MSNRTKNILVCVIFKISANDLRLKDVGAFEAKIIL
jgi:hypothetical protein